MSPDRPRHRPWPEVGSSSASAPDGRTAAARVARFLFAALPGDAPWHRILLSIAVTALLTGIGLSCVLAKVLDGHPVVFTWP